MKPLRIATNVVAFQAAWLCAVGGAATGRLWLGPAAALAAVAVHLTLAPRPARELGALAAVAAVGTAWDSLPSALGLIEYRGALRALGGEPLWIATLWLAFATTLNVSLRFLRERRVAAVAFGALGGPLCYAAAERLGALALMGPAKALAVQALGWAVLLPASLALSARFDGAVPQRTETAHV